MKEVKEEYRTNFFDFELSGYLAKYVEILGKVCGDTWQSMWRYLAKYVEIQKNRGAKA